ncbi:transcriptional regulator [Candidatus Uhrbacteria bacterium CG10_big_fil_rev_8_21_14_0_10_48_16]|uniref:Transcriptional regulator n=1 Tax=Candidatus Uhrbacteria bacterium CG10_big_fil_rev_8_21_14_0_10_48_16 TaxID=1975038 RepID=A0A2M8LH26_9BACT|nr:MAG: transcriptional regulator [Candidatus Uhrbacteria bacterium CG10_big_fil_rev_8_21_14_0_10_48_16]
MSTPTDWREDLVHLIQLADEDPTVLPALLEDLLTPEELTAMAQRWQIIKELYRGTPQREISQTLGVGVATVTRGSRMLRNPQGGFRRIIDMILSTKRPTGLTKAWRTQLTE